MDKSDLLAEFSQQLKAYDTFQGYIDKAKGSADKFPPAVVAKVVKEKTASMDAVAAALDPLVPEVRSIISGLEADRAGVEATVGEAQLGLSELELRQLIGELDDATFEAEAATLQATVDQQGESLQLLDAELAEFRGVLDAWATRRPSGAAPEAEPEPEPIEVPEPDDDLLDALEDEEPAAFAVTANVSESSDDIDDDMFADDDPAAVDDDAFADPGARGDGVHASLVSGVADDVSAVFDDEEEEEALAFDEAPPSQAEDDLGELDDAEEASPVVSIAADGTIGEAVLIVGEGTEEEHVYPFTGEVISLGRGRDNTIQVKNDSKVSRYHCKLFKKDTSFYIEDNKSANGTLVDGELITEKRLLGGEEVIIGETFFRFRINP